MDGRPINWPQGMDFKPALRQALDAAARAAPAVMAARCGCNYDGESIKVSFLNRNYRVRFPEVRVEGEDTTRPPEGVQLIILHYLLSADGTPPAGMWVTYRHIPDAFLFESSFNAMAVQPLARAFGAGKEAFCRAAESLGGVAMTRTGDAAYRFIALPQIPMGCVLYLADEELAASVSILFDAVA
ncbi:MAG: DUF3786 domain-containing protein, partial [Chloroflexota bacterium]